MVLVDTSVWVSHLRESHPRMVSLLNDGDCSVSSLYHWGTRMREHYE